MFPSSAYRMFLALSLLTAEPDAPAPDYHPALLEPLREVAVQLEILDAREHMLSDPGYFVFAMKALRERWRELRTAPPLSEADRFPRRELVDELLAANRAMCHDLNDRLGYDTVHEGEIRAAVAECEHLWRVWGLVRDARTDYWYVHHRRQALLDLRRELGPVRFYRGEMVPHLSVWRLPAH